jgi:hypothetical protein
MARLGIVGIYLGSVFISGGLITLLAETAHWIFSGTWSPVLLWELLTHLFEWEPQSLSGSDLSLLFYTVLDWRLDRTLMSSGLALLGAGLVLVR